MKAINGLLPVNVSYRIIEVTYQGDNYQSCDNCGKMINTIATVENEAGFRHDIGIDCAEGLMGCNSLEYWQLKQKSKRANQLKRYVAKLKKAARDNKLKIDDHYHTIYGDDGIWSIRLPSTSEAVKLYNLSVS